MIEPAARPEAAAIAHHYDELDPFYRALWGEHLHHGLWTTGREHARDAAIAMVDAVATRAEIGAGSQVCDVGCGYGAPARHLAGRGASVTALTLSSAQYRHAVRQAPPDGANAAHFLLRDWLANELPSEHFDAVVAIESLAHMPSKPAALAEAFRVLKPGGRMVACVWMAAPDPAPWEVRHLLRPICEEGRLPGLPNADEYGRWAGEAGFEGVSVKDVSDRVARTWTISLRHVLGSLVRPSSWRYLLGRHNTERRFALSVIRLLIGYRTGAMRYGILTGTR